MALLNLHRAFTDAATENDYLARLTVPEPREGKLRKARDEIRETLKAGFSDWQRFADRSLVMETTAVRKGATEPRLRLKFRMQGSASPAYRTLNDPAHPPQQIDYDDGVYLPVSFLAKTGNPVIAAAGYYRLVETVLAPLCEKRKWTLDRRAKNASASSSTAKLTSTFRCTRSRIRSSFGWPRTPH